MRTARRWRDLSTTTKRGHAKERDARPGEMREEGRTTDDVATTTTGAERARARAILTTARTPRKRDDSFVALFLRRARTRSERRDDDVGTTRNRDPTD